MNPSHRQRAIQRAKHELATNPVYLDTETTGMGKSDTVIEISVIDDNQAPLVDTLVRTNKAIPRDAERIHGITQDMTRNAPTWPEIWQEVEAALQGRAVAVYNVGFDVRMIKQTHTQHWMNWKLPAGTRFFDVMEIYAQFLGEWDPARKRFRYHSLSNAGKQAGISLPNTHRAHDDCLLTRALLHYMARQGEI